MSEWSTMEGGAMTLPSVDNGLSPAKMARRRLSMGASLLYMHELCWVG